MFGSDSNPGSNCNIGEYCVMEGATAKCINVSPCTATTFSCPNENEICQETFLFETFIVTISVTVTADVRR